jgi:hypothetical protein
MYQFLNFLKILAVNFSLLFFFFCILVRNIEKNNLLKNQKVLVDRYLRVSSSH